MKTWIAAGPRFRTRSSLASNKRHFRPNLDERCRAFDDGEYLVADQAPEYVQLGQDAEAGNGPGRLHDLAAMRARVFFGRAIHPANSDPFTPGSLSSHSVAEREMGWSRLSTVLTAHSYPSGSDAPSALTGHIWVCQKTSVMKCPLWVISRYCRGTSECPLYPRKRTSRKTVVISAPHKLTLSLAATSRRKVS